jgi:hypothetical protein
MAYNKFKKLEQLRKELGIKDLVRAWLPKKNPTVSISDKLLDALADAEKEPLGTEKAKSEYIIVPVLKELRRNNPGRFNTFSGYEFNVDSKQGPAGYCDFIFSAEAERAEITAPIFCLVEAKNDNVEKGIAQCGAEMYAAYLYNEIEGSPRDIIYGCVTTAFSWAFLKLEHQTLYIDPNYAPLTFTQPDKVLATLQWILDDCPAPEKSTES